MQSFSLVTIVVLTTMCIPSIYGQKMSTLVKRDDLSSVKLFCQKTGGKGVKQNDFACIKAAKDSKPTQPSCGGFDGKKKVRGTLGCSNGGKLQIKFKDCDVGTKAAKAIFCEIEGNKVNSRQGELSCKAGSNVVVKNAPEIKCHTRERSPKEIKPQCHPIKKGQTGPFSGKIECPKNADFVFRFGKSVAENPCKTNKHGQGAPIFCTPKDWA